MDIKRITSTANPKAQPQPQQVKQKTSAEITEQAAVQSSLRPRIESPGEADSLTRSLRDSLSTDPAKGLSAQGAGLNQALIDDLLSDD